MSLQRQRGIEQAIAVFDALPNAGRDELADMMGRLGRDLLAVERERVARATGALAAKLKSQLLVDEKRVRLQVGLFGANARSLLSQRSTGYYGRFVEYGRRAQTVVVHRLSREARTVWRARIRAGDARRSRKPADLGSTYKLRVRAEAARPFVNPVPDGATDAIVADRLQTFLDRVMARAEAA